MRNGPKVEVLACREIFLYERDYHAKVVGADYGDVRCEYRSIKIKDYLRETQVRPEGCQRDLRRHGRRIMAAIGRANDSLQFNSFYTNTANEYMNSKLCLATGKVQVACTSPLRSASSARTSVAYCNASSMGIKCIRSVSVGSLIHPSIGMALSGSKSG